MKIENFPFRDGERLNVSTFTGRGPEGILLAINSDGLILCQRHSDVTMIPWSNVASVHSLNLSNDRVREIADTFVRPEPIKVHPALAEGPAPYSDQWLAKQQEI